MKIPLADACLAREDKTCFFFLTPRPLTLLSLMSSFWKFFPSPPPSRSLFLWVTWGWVEPCGLNGRPFSCGSVLQRSLSSILGLFWHAPMPRDGHGPPRFLSGPGCDTFLLACPFPAGSVPRSARSGSFCSLDLIFRFRFVRSGVQKVSFFFWQF